MRARVQLKISTILPVLGLALEHGAGKSRNVQLITGRWAARRSSGRAEDTVTHAGSSEALSVLVFMGYRHVRRCMPAMALDG